MAIRRTKAALPPRTVTLDQEVAYAICRAFYSGDCACADGTRDAVCQSAEWAARDAKALLLTSQPRGSEAE